MNHNQLNRLRSLQVKYTADGSPTLFVPELNEHYHSVHGALQESKHVFIDAGLKPLLQQALSDISVFEVGFGTGLNAILTFEEAKKTGAKINYDTIEAYPLPAALINSLRVEAALTDELLAPYFALMHSSGWEEKTAISPEFSLRKWNTTLEKAILPSAAYHLIYFDAFAPEKQPELWEETIFCKIHDCLKPGGLLVTYCAKGVVKRRLKSAGFEVETIAGPPGKREMI